ncbi:MAG TPA: TonB-dependent receptor [Opitutaceae bacterium]|nr:TonB-dependent receptor [Opitutaceae bacterium]
MNNAEFVRRRFVRGLATGLLLTQPALQIFGQNTAPAASSAEDPAVMLDRFEVTAGFAGSLAAAAEAKQDNKAIVEVIMAEDIGKLPDVSIADSLTRLTGLTTQRTNGRSQAISIRGLTGDFSTGMLNGREQVSTSLNRAVEYDQYPAELLNGVVVYKTAAANLTGQGLAGTVDLQTVKPLEKGKRTLALNGYYEWTEYGQLTPGADDKGQRFNVSYIDQFAGGTVGLAIGFSHSSKPFEGEQFQAWGYPTDGQGNLAIGGTKSYVRTSNLDRDGLMAVLEFKPNENVHSVVDVYTSEFEETQLLRGMEIPLAFWSSAVLQPGYTTSGGLITRATLTNVQPVIRNDVFQRTDDLFAIGWNLKLNQKSAWPITFDAGYSKVERRDMNIETWSGIGFRGTPTTTADTVTVDLSPGSIPQMTTTREYATGAGVAISDPQGWGPSTLPGGGMYGYLKEFAAKDELGQFQLFTERQLDNRYFSAVQAGVSYTERYKRDGEKPSGFLHRTTNVAGTIPLPPKIGETDMTFMGLGKIYAYDTLAAWNSGVFGFTENLDTGIVANRFEINETISRAYAQLDIDTKWGSVPVTGNLGVQVIDVEQESTGWAASGTALNRTTQGAKYTDVAPSLNLVFQPRERSYVRFSLARQIARPRMHDMRAGRTWSYSPALASSTNLTQSPWSGSGGNPMLRPWKSDSVDLSLEHYFADNRGYIALAGFYKDLKNFIYQQGTLADFSGYPVSAGPEPALRHGTITAPANGDGGRIQGVELTVSLPSELISDSLRGFGLIVGGAYTDSSIKPWGPTGGDAPIAGLSRKVTNATFYYERHGFSARVSHRYRSENRQYITTFGVPNLSGDVSPNGGFSVAQPESVFDAQVSYSIQRGSMKGLTLYLQGYNLTDEPLITYNNGDPRQVINYQQYGASYSAGVSYKF